MIWCGKCNISWKKRKGYNCRCVGDDEPELGMRCRWVDGWVVWALGRVLHLRFGTSAEATRAPLKGSVTITLSRSHECSTGTTRVLTRDMLLKKAERACSTSVSTGAAASRRSPFRCQDCRHLSSGAFLRSQVSSCGLLKMIHETAGFGDGRRMLC